MFKHLNALFIGLALFACTSSAVAQTIKPIETPVPVRPAGQKDVVGLTTPKLDVVRVGFIGLGMRGPGAVERFTHIPGTQIVALCDLIPERVAGAQKILTKANLPEAASYSGSEDAWKKLCERKDIDLVYIATDWKHHAQMAIYAMEHGKHVAIEVPSAMTLDEIWALINTSEKTRKHCMQLENCVYDFFELTTLNMAQQVYSVKCCTQKVLTSTTLKTSGRTIGTTGVWITTRTTVAMYTLLTAWARLASCSTFTVVTK